MANHGLFKTQEATTTMGFFSFPPNTAFSAVGFHQSNLSSSGTLVSSATPYLIKHRNEENAFGFEGIELLSSQKSTANHHWAFGELGEGLNGRRNGGDDHNLVVNPMKMKKLKARRKLREPRFRFKTMSDVDVLDDGYKWRKYGQKVVKNTQHPRSYYRCTQDNCRVKKRVERLAEDPRMVITTYEGRHGHSPSNELEECQAPSHMNNFFW